MLKQPYAKLSSFITTRGSSIMKSSSHSSQSSVSDGMVGGGTDGGHRQHHHHAHAAHHHAHHHGQQHNSGSTTSIFNSHHFSITNPMNSFFFESFSNISPNHSVFDDTDDDDDEFGSFEQVRVSLSRYTSPFLFTNRPKNKNKEKKTYRNSIRKHQTVNQQVRGNQLVSLETQVV